MEKLSAIAAIGRNREIGRNNELIWKLDTDFERMKETVAGHPLIMGRKTYESIGREPSYSPCIVLTRNETYVSPYENQTHTTIVHSLEEAVDIAKEIASDGEVFVFGGEEIYAEAMPYTDRLYLTEIDEVATDADAFFPDYTDFTNVTESTEHQEGDVQFTMSVRNRADQEAS